MINAILIGIAIGGYTFNLATAFWTWWITRRAHAFMAGIAMTLLLVQNMFIFARIINNIAVPLQITSLAALAPMVFVLVSITPKRALWSGRKS